jgi:hypothetical protein
LVASAQLPSRPRERQQPGSSISGVNPARVDWRSMRYSRSFTLPMAVSPLRRSGFLRAALIQILFSIRSERQLMEQMQYNLLFRWFVGLGVDDPVWVPTVFTKNRDGF